MAVALLLLVAFLFQGTWALAGTTGSLSGVVTDPNGAPVAGASVKVVAASQSGSTTTDATGHFTFLSLTPDTYTVSIEKSGFNPISFAGVTVFADQNQTLSFRLQKELSTIARTTATAPGALVKAGTTSDVYSVNAATAAKVTGLGGGGGLDSAYSAIATMPGAYVPVGQAGWYQSVYIRGGDYDQVGYEVDGVPVNRAFDNYPTNTASALGQQEVQVYTGAAPSNAEGQGLSGFINQVIKTGTYPGFADSDLGIGGPIFYHKANIEVGGATPDRRFSYYAGFGGYNQAFRSVDQQNGASYQNNWGYVTGATCPAAPAAGGLYPGCYAADGTYAPSNAVNPWYILGPFSYYSTQLITDRENVVNFHFAIPHKKDGGRDDLQLLWQGSDLKTFYDGSQSGLGSQAFVNQLGGYSFPTSVTYPGPLNQVIPAAGATGASFATPQTYCFPSVNSAAACSGGPIPYTLNDSVDNAVGIVKLQYQKNFGSSAYLRVYGYTVYSNWFNWGPNSANLCCAGVPVDYEVYTHSRGLSATFADQLNSKNLLQVQGSYTDANSNRINNNTMFAGGGTHMAVLVNGANPMSGICYTPAAETLYDGHNNVTGITPAGTPIPCDGKYSTSTQINPVTGNPYTDAQGNAIKQPSSPWPGYITVGGLQGTGTGAFGGPTDTFAPGTTCGGGPCAWYVADNGFNGPANRVTPRFYSGSLTDEWDPTDRLHLNLGVRFDSFQYIPQASDTGARPFWTNVWNQSYCVNSTQVGANAVEKTDPTQSCSAAFGAGYVPATVTDVSSTQTYTVFQPRISATYTLNPLNVLRFSYGKYDQAPNTAFQQYNYLQQNLPLATKNFYSLGFTAPTHPIRPETSYNTDFSWEHQIKGTDMSFKLTPFYRKTKDQIQQFYLDIRTNFVSGLNVGSQTSEGLEFQFQKGDFSKNGFAALFSYAYTNAYVTYSPAPNGATPITTINQAIDKYNAFTKAGGGAPCYTTAGVAQTNSANCTAADVANPYYNAPEQAHFDEHGKYAPYDLFAGPAPGAGGYGSFVAPNVATLVLNYKHDKFAVTPALQFSSGNKYGYPIAQMGIDPSSCTATLGAVSGDPRYPYGGYGSSYNAADCAQQAVAIPNPGTGAFDAVGGFKQPNRLTMSMQLSYDVSPRVSAVLTLANIFDTCFGGTKGSWTNPQGVASSKVCGYGGGYSFAVPPVANGYNPPLSNVQPFQQQSYVPSISALPFNAYLDFKIKI